MVGNAIWNDRSLSMVYGRSQLRSATGMEGMGFIRIADAAMLGFWEEHPAVSTSDEAVKVTAYRKPGKVLLSLGNYSDEVKTVKLNIDWEQTGLDPQQVKLMAPGIPDMQQATEWDINAPIVTAPRKGWLIYIIPK